MLGPARGGRMRSLDQLELTWRFCELDEPLGVLGVARPRRGRRGRTGARVGRTERPSGAPGRGRTRTRPAIAPSTVRAPSVTTSTHPDQPEERRVVGGVVRLRPRTSRAGRRRARRSPAESANAMHPRSGRVDADRRRRGLAAAERVEEPPGRPAPDQHDERRRRPRGRRRQKRKNAWSSVDEPGSRARRAGPRPPPTQSSGTRTLSNMSANASVASAR